MPLGRIRNWPIVPARGGIGKPLGEVEAAMEAQTELEAEEEAVEAVEPLAVLEVRNRIGPPSVRHNRIVEPCGKIRTF
jgi:hypothetical protein